jgi:hypothetical protein
MSADVEPVAMRGAVLISATLASLAVVTMAPARPLEANRSQGVRTLVTTKHSIGAAAQDGPRIAWTEPDALWHRSCSAVRLLDLRSGATTALTKRHGDTCDSGGELDQLALAGSRALWGMFWAGNSVSGVDALTGSVGARRDIQVGSFMWDNEYDRAGFETAGDGTTLVFVVPLGSYGEGHTASGAYRVIGRRLDPIPTSIPFGPTAVGGGRIALAGEGGGGAHTTTRVDLHSASSTRLLRRIPLVGSIRSVAVSSRVLAVLVQRPSGTRIAVFDPATGASRGAIAVSEATVQVSVAGDRVVFSAGKAIWLLETTSMRKVLLATPPVWPIGVSIEGKRVIWVENSDAGGRIKAITLTK